MKYLLNYKQKEGIIIQPGAMHINQQDAQNSCD